MTAGYYSQSRVNSDGEEWDDEYYGFDTLYFSLKGSSITPQNIGIFKILRLFYITSLDDVTLDISATQKCLISFKGRTYRVDRPESYNKQDYFNCDIKYPWDDSFDDSIIFTDGEKVEITYELL